MTLLAATAYKKGLIALHFGEKYASLPLPFLRKGGRLVEQISFKSVARFTIICQVALWVSSWLSAAVENDAVAPVYSPSSVAVDLDMSIDVGNESVPMQLAQCWYTELAILSSAKVEMYFFK